MRLKLLAKDKLARTLPYVMLAILLVVGFGVRMVNLFDPPLDFHPVRQLRSAIIARGVFYTLNTSADPAVRQAAINLAALDIHEPPIIEQFVGLVYFLVNSEQLWISRIVSSLFWMIGGLALFSLARRHTSFGAAMIGLAFYLLLPFGVVASRSFQPDPWMVMWILVAAWAADHWVENPNWKWTVITGILGGIAILVKVMAGFFLAGLLVMAVLAAVGFRGLLRSAKPWAMAVLVLAPAVIYYLIMHTGRSAEYFSFWTLSFSKLLFTSKFYVQWLAMINSLTGLTLLVAAFIGVALAAYRFRWILIGLWIGYILFGLAWPFQYTTHDYYHLALVPIIGLSITPLIDLIFRQVAQQGWVWRCLAVGVLVAAAGFEFWVGRSTLIAHDYGMEPQSWKNVGEAIPAGEQFVALTGDYGLRLSYYGWRNASYYWPAGPDLDVAQIRDQSPLDTVKLFKEVTEGRKYFLVTSLGEFDAQPELKTILSGYELYHQGSGWMVFDLTRPRR